MDQQRIEGVLVAVTSSAYGSFKDQQTGEMVPGGETLWAWVSVGFDQRPVEVKLPAAERITWDSLREVGQGVVVAMIVELRAKNRSIERRFLTMTAVAEPVEPVSMNGKAAR
jgi:hypothetical protein